MSSFFVVHCVGIGGIGISGVARFCYVQGKRVSGSDVARSRVTEALVREGIEVHIGFSQAEWLPKDCDLLVYSEAVPESAPERVEATRRGIRQLGHFGFLGELAKGYRTICISGTNGKSTTTAMTGKIFEDAGLDPTVFVGSLLPEWPLGNVRVGKSNILIIEGDEYKKKMLALHPEVTLVTNIEADHLDVYKDLAEIEDAFHTLIEQTSRVAFLHPADAVRGMVCGRERADVRIFGEALMQGKRIVQDGVQTLLLRERRISWLPFFTRFAGEIRLRIPGSFNMMNALAAMAIGEVFDIDAACMQRTLENFSGIWRRFERVGACCGAYVISDYAHHPTAIVGTIAAAKEFFPDKRIVVLFEPHQHSRTKELFADFVAAFDGADVLILSEIYGVTGRTRTEEHISSLDLLHAIETRCSLKCTPAKPMYFTKDLIEAEQKVREVAGQNDVILVLGAGSVDSVARNLVA